MVRKSYHTEFIIVHPDGKPIYPEYLSQMLTKLQNKAKLPQCPLIYTMGMPDTAFLGDTTMVSTNETWQYDNYEQYFGEFDMDVKRKFREEVFPEDC